MPDTPIYKLKEPVVLVAAAAAAGPIPRLKEPVLGLKEPVVLVAAAAAAATDAPAGDSILGKLLDRLANVFQRKQHEGRKESCPSARSLCTT